MKRFLFLLPLALLLLASCKEKHYCREITGKETFLCQIVFDDASKRDFTVVTDVLYAGEDTSSRYKMNFYMPDGWDDTYPILLDRYYRPDGANWAAWTAYQGAPVAEKALKEGNMIVVLVAYEEWTAIEDILLAHHFLQVYDDDLPGDSKNILTAAYFDFE